jgi:hypothetical protein
VIVKEKAQVLEAIKTDSLPVPLGGVFLFVPIQTRSEGEPTAVLIIRLLPNESPSGSPGAVDAAEVIAQLTPHFD